MGTGRNAFNVSSTLPVRHGRGGSWSDHDGRQRTRGIVSHGGSLLPGLVVFTTSKSARTGPPAPTQLCGNILYVIQVLW